MTEAVVTPNTPWVPATGVEPDLAGHITTKGWDKKSASEAALEAARAHREAEKLIGVPSNQIIRIPTDPKDEAGMKAVWQRLGAPADAKDYDFSTVKAKGDLPINDALAQALREAAASGHIPKDAATTIAAAVSKYIDNTKDAELADYTAKIEASKATLVKNWGANLDANTVIARNAAAALGVTKDDIAALEKVIGFDRVMEMFRSVGTKIGEDKFVVNPGTNTGVMTRDQAVAKKNDLMNDQGWRDRYLKGGVPENRELQALVAIIAGDDTDNSRARTGR